MALSTQTSSEIGAKLRALRNERGYSLSQVARATGISRSFIGLVEGVILVATPALIRDFSPQLGRASAMGFWTLGPVVGSLVVAGCAQSPPRASGAYRVRVSAPVQREARPRPRPIDRALLAPQAAPDCDFKEPQGDTADPNVLARLKLNYERQIDSDCFSEVFITEEQSY